VLYSNHFAFVFHYAAVVGVQRTLDNPIMVLDDVKGFENLLMLCKNTGVKRVFYSSSSEVYGEPFEFPQNEETTPLNSRLPYAIVKNIGEAYIKSFYQEFGLEYTIFRYFNTYGPKQSDDFVISKFLNKALENEPITIYGDGSQTRTFCYVDDNVDTCLKCMEENAIINDTVNIGGADELTILELAEVIIKVTNSSSEVIHLPALKEGDMTRRQPDNSKMKQILQRDLTPLEEGLKRVLKSWGKLN
jgi:UDP-glucose 4-epimerase